MLSSRAPFSCPRPWTLSPQQLPGPWEALPAPLQTVLWTGSSPRARWRGPGMVQAVLQTCCGTQPGAGNCAVEGGVGAAGWMIYACMACTGQCTDACMLALRCSAAVSDA